MQSAILAFSLGICLLQCRPSLPALGGVCAAAFVVWLVGCWVLAKYPPARRASCLAAVLLLGFAYAGWRAQWRMDDALASALEGEDVVLVGVVEDLPQPFDRGVRFLLRTESAPAGLPSRVQLTWYQAAKTTALTRVPEIHAGARWQLRVKLRRAHGDINPHGFDYEAWLFERGIRAVGYVRADPANRCLTALVGAPVAWIDHWRELIRARFEAVLPQANWRSVLVALAVGDQSGVTREQWQLFARTGISHLISVSGLHITLIAAIFALAVGWGWRRIPWLALRLPAQKASLAAGTCAAAFYVALAGFGVPAQRTLYMLMVATLALWLGRGAQASRSLALALGVVLLIDPWAGLSAGFWLSFGAVAALFLAAQGDPVNGRIRQWLHAQWAVTVLTLPLLLGLFQQFSLISPLTNAVAIPVVSFVVTPLALIFAALPLPSLAEGAHWVLGWLMRYLQWCGQSPLAVWQQAAPPVWLVGACCLAALWALLPRATPARYTGLLCFLPLLTWQPVRPAMGVAQITVLDVGQGLAVHVRTRNHDLVYDTGPRYAPELDAGSRIILPYLRAGGTERLDMLVVSHQDSDHAGGAQSILEGITVGQWRASLPPDNPLLSQPVPFRACTKGEAWEWEGVRFEFLYPDADITVRGNNESSCVLRVEAAGVAMLLTGDIEQVAEARLLAQSPMRLAAQVVIAPHHGSRSSSGEAFVHAVGAQAVIYTAGYRNRFHHPAADVMTRYARAGAQAYRSDQDGAIMFDLRLPLRIVREREEGARYWRGFAK